MRTWLGLKSASIAEGGRRLTPEQFGYGTTVSRGNFRAPDHLGVDRLRSTLRRQGGSNRLISELRFGHDASPWISHNRALHSATGGPPG